MFLKIDHHFEITQYKNVRLHCTKIKQLHVGFYATEASDNKFVFCFVLKWRLVKMAQSNSKQKS